MVLSQHVNTRYALELLSAGTDGIGYLLKERVSDLAELAVSVNRVGQGARYSTRQSLASWWAAAASPTTRSSTRPIANARCSR